jgi:hypothetical protein
MAGFSFSGSESIHDDAPSPVAVQEGTPPRFSVSGSESFEKAPEQITRQLPQNAGIKDIASTAYANIPSSARKAVGELIYPFQHPKETLAGMKQLGAGLASEYGGGYLGKDPQAERALETVKDYYKDRYGSLEGAKRAFAEDPIGTMMDVSTVMTGAGGALRAPLRGAQLAGRTGSMMTRGLGAAGELIGETGRLIDPVAASTKLGAMAAEPVTKGIIPNVLSMQTGKSAESLRRAEEAGASGNAEFWKNLYERKTPEEVIATTKNALEAVKDQRSQEYLSTSQGWRSSQVPLSFGTIDSTLNNIVSTYTPRGGSAPARYMQKPLQEIQDTIDHYRGSNKTMSDLDLMKRDLDKLYNSPDFRTGEAKAALGTVRNEVWQTIASHDPEYAKIMGEYEKATNEINSIISEIGTDRSSVPNRLRKIIKSSGTEALKRLAKEEPDLPYMLAGQELSTLHPGGIRGALVSSLPYVAAAGTIHPAVALGAGLSLPRVAGTVQAGLGTARTLPMMAESYAIPQAARRVAREVGRTAPMKPEEPSPEVAPENIRFAFATGGGVRRGMNAATLIAAVERAKADGQKNTESLLEAPDEHIVQALKVANEHI